MCVYVYDKSVRAAPRRVLIGLIIFTVKSCAETTDVNITINVLISNFFFPVVGSGFLFTLYIRSESKLAALLFCDILFRDCKNSIRNDAKQDCQM